MPEKNTSVARPLRQSPRVSQVDLHDLRLQGRPRVRVDDEPRRDQGDFLPPGEASEIEDSGRDFALIDFLCFVMVITSHDLGCVM